MKEQEIRSIVSQVIENIQISEDTKDFPVDTSARHVHLTEKAVAVLFGDGAKLIEKRPLTLPGFLAEQRVSIVTKKGSMHNVAVLGPERSAIQVEISRADARTLGINPPINDSGDLTGAEDVIIVGEKGCIEAKGSVIISQAHVHMNSGDAQRFDVRDGDRVDVLLKSNRPVTLHNVLIRVREDMHAYMHIDVDEANAAAWTPKTRGVIISR